MALQRPRPWSGQSVSEAFVKLPSRDVLNFSESVAQPDVLAQLFIDDIGGVELSQLTNYQTIYGTNVNYTIVAGLRNITAEYNPADWLLNKLPNYKAVEVLDYNDYFSGINVLATGDVEINFLLLPNDVDIEIQTDYNAIIDIQETA